MSDDFSLIRDRSVRLFTFLRKFVEARSKAIRSLDSYESVLWGNDLPDALEVYSIAKKSDKLTSNPDLWFEVEKPDLKNPPSPPAEIESWLDPNDLSDSELDHPILLEQIPGDQVRTASKSDGASGSSATMLRLADHPQVLRVHEKYVKEKWRPWAERDCQHRAVLEIYTELFSMYQKQQRFRESHEVVVGFGLLTWKPAGTYEVKRHVLTVQAELSFNALKGVISLRLGGNGAQDQMWLFHSVTKNDLSTQCLRYRLLEYAENPQIAPLTIEGLNVGKLKIDVQTVDREQTKPPEPFDSWFEVDVFLWMHGRGYRVIPQFEVADYHIDLVVEGMHGRLAVECDGDFWHGPERYEADMIRERMGCGSDPEQRRSRR